MSEGAVRIAAQAKINLHLRILARDDSGFHSIETIFHRVDLADELEVEATAGEKRLDVAGDGTGAVESNLAWRAAEAYAERTGWPAGFRIRLTKRIPVGAGLGGGSADAAAVLRALNFRSPHPITSLELLSVAAALGSDVPFLASDAVMALGWGRGERLFSLPALPQRDVVLISPDFSVSTADAYRWVDEDQAVRAASGKPDKGERLPARMFGIEELSSWTSIARFAANDFEAPILSRHPALRGHLDAMRDVRAILARMTGSGSTIFGVMESSADEAAFAGGHSHRVSLTKTSIIVVPPETLG